MAEFGDAEEPEVGDDDLALLEEHVPAFQVFVDDILRVQITHTLCDLRSNDDGAIQVVLGLLHVQTRVQRLTPTQADKSEKTSVLYKQGRMDNR